MRSWESGRSLLSQVSGNISKKILFFFSIYIKLFARDRYPGCNSFCSLWSSLGNMNVLSSQFVAFTCMNNFSGLPLNHNADLTFQHIGNFRTQCFMLGVLSGNPPNFVSTKACLLMGSANDTQEAELSPSE